MKAFEVNQPFRSVRYQFLSLEDKFLIHSNFRRFDLLQDDIPSVKTVYWSWGVLTGHVFSVPPGRRNSHALQLRIKLSKKAQDGGALFSALLLTGIYLLLQKLDLVWLYLHRTLGIITFVAWSRASSARWWDPLIFVLSFAPIGFIFPWYGSFFFHNWAVSESPALCSPLHFFLCLTRSVARRQVSFKWPFEARIWLILGLPSPLRNYQTYSQMFAVDKHNGTRFVVCLNQLYTVRRCECRGVFVLGSSFPESP